MHGDRRQSDCGLITHDGSDLYGFAYEAAKTEKVYFDNYFASVEKSLAGAFPGYEISIADWSKDLTKFVVYAGNEQRSRMECYFFDVSKGISSQKSLTYAPWLKDYEFGNNRTIYLYSKRWA